MRQPNRACRQDIKGSMHCEISLDRMCYVQRSIFEEQIFVKILWTSYHHPDVQYVPSPNFSHKVKGTCLHKMSLYALAIQMSFTGTKWISLDKFQQDNAPGQEVRSIKITSFSSGKPSLNNSSPWEGKAAFFHAFGIGCSTSTFGCHGQVFTYFWPDSLWGNLLTPW